MSTPVRFSVCVETEEGEAVFVTGNVPELGSWLPQQGVQLQCEDEHDRTWSCVIQLDGDTDYQYRYCVCRFLSAGSDHQRLIIVRWESNLIPRSISTKNGQLKHHEVSEFGNYGGHRTVSTGWLSGQTDVQLRLHSNPIYMFKKRHQAQKYSIKCLPLDFNLRDPSMTDQTQEEESKDGPQPARDVCITCFSLTNQAMRPQNQGQFGLQYHTDDYIVFQSQTFSPQYMGYQVDLFVEETNRMPRYVGNAFILPFNQTESLGTRKIPIIGLKHKPIGEVTVEFLITKPYHQSFDVEVSYRSHWKRLGRSLDVGHRGMGSSYHKGALLRENTVASLLTAGDHGADFVEFDVMLSKDLHPVVYHDFSVRLLHRKRDHEEEMLEIPVKDLTCQQLQSLRLYHSTSSAENQIHVSGEIDDSDDHQPFPTLKQCLLKVTPNIGFNIEIKHPQLNEDGWEMQHYFDHNLHIDTILDTIFEHAGSRRIIFSSFDPDTCIMLQLKQNKYPVLFLNNGTTQKYSPYVDYRARDFDAGINFAIAHGLLGVDYHSEGLLRDMSIIKKTRDAGLVLFVWGEDINDADTINSLRRHGVDGIIYDRIDFHKSENKSQGFVMDDKLMTSVSTTCASSTAS